MKQLLWVCLIALALIAGGCSEWWDGNGSGEACEIFIQYEWSRDCTYFVTLYALPCQDKIQMYHWECESFQGEDYPAVNGEATFKFTFNGPETYEIEVKGYDKDGNAIAGYKGGKKITCREGY